MSDKWQGDILAILDDQFKTRNDFLVSTICSMCYFNVWTLIVPEKYRHLGYDCGNRDGPEFAFYPKKLRELANNELVELYWAIANAKEDPS